jgi:hypothetical protein
MGGKPTFRWRPDPNQELITTGWEGWKEEESLSGASEQWRTMPHPPDGSLLRLEADYLRPNRI